LQLEEEQVILKKYIAKLKRQLEAQEQRFNDRPEPPQLENLMAEITVLQQRLDLVIGDMSVISEPPIELDAETEKQKLDFQYQLVCDRPNSRAVLMEALSVAQERLIIVCPWLNCNSINDELLRKFRDCLNRGCAIDIGWGYLGDRQKIGKGWRYNALADLQELESAYPGQFSLNLLGTHENYLVCDSSFAMLGSHNFLTNSDQSAEKEVGIRTDDCQIVKQLIERFDSSQVLNEEEIESRFIASSDSIDRADYLEGLAADAAEGEIDLEESAEDLDDQSEASLEPVVTVEEFWKRYTQGERDFTGINLAGADFRGKNLGAKLSQQTKFTNANLAQSNLSGINLRGADLKNADLTNANLSNSNLLEANLDGANFKGVQLQGALCNQATLFPADFDPVKAGACLIAPYVSLQNADLTGWDLSSVNLMGANLQGANLTSAELSSSNLKDANLSGAKLQGANLHSSNLSHANLKQVNLNDATLRSADLTTADLTESELRQADLRYAKLRGADLISADIRAANLNYADLSGANLTGAKIGGAHLENAQLTGAIMPDGSTHE
jgi:uncharacterized protein YjbI with pentapeptide repeats